MSLTVTKDVDGIKRGKGKLLRTRCHDCGRSGLINVRCTSEEIGYHWRYFKPVPRTNTPAEEHLCDGFFADYQLDRLPNVLSPDQILRI